MSALRSGQLAPIDSDNGLVAAVRRGDDRAFGELYSRYGRRIVSYVFGMLGDHGRADDVAQEVFISALRRMRATDRPIAFKPWIYEIARNACIDEFRRTRRAQEVPLDSSDEPERPDRQLESRTSSPDAAFERRQQLDDLRGAFRGLSESHHKIIVLRELEGLSYTEIGKRLGMTRPVVESTLFRARRRLGAEYEEIASGRRCEQVQTVIDSGGEKAVRALGIRERRRVARHVAHCQPCRRYAHLAGVQDSILKGPGLVEKIAALLPIPAFLRWRRGGDSQATTAAGSHSAAVLQWAPKVVQFADPASPAIGFGRTTAAVVAAAALAGGGAVGTLSTVGGGGKHPNRAGVVHLSNAPSGGAPTQARVAPRPAAGGQPQAAPATSSPSAGGTGGSAPSQAQPTSSSPPSSGSSAPESDAAQTPASPNQTPSTSQASAPQSSQGQSQSSGGLPQLPQLPQLPLGQSGSNLPQLPQINLPQLPQLPHLPSLGQIIGTVRKLLQ